MTEISPTFMLLGSKVTLALGGRDGTSGPATAARSADASKEFGRNAASTRDAPMIPASPMKIGMARARRDNSVSAAAKILETPVFLDVRAHFVRAILAGFVH